MSGVGLDAIPGRHITDAKGCLKRRILKHGQNASQLRRQLDDALG